ncbi:MAG: response regulator transcription factor [Acidimicrobiia bacterium]
MNEHPRVLVVEGEQAIVDILRLGLSYEGFEVVVARDGHQAVRLHRLTHPDLVILDMMLPGLDGLEALERMRTQRDTPVMLLGSQDALDDRGLKAGVDDYLTKPFQFPELVARARAVLRRRGAGDIIEVGDLRIDRPEHIVTRAGRRLELTTKQFDLLVLLASNLRRVLTKEQIYQSVWGWDHLENPNVVEQHVSHLRRQVDRGHSRKLIHTVRGVGYVLRDEGDH